MGMDIYQNYSQFYRGTEPIKNYGSGKGRKDTLVRYEFNTTDDKGNKVMDKMTREETLQAMKEISSQYGDNVMVEFSGDGMAKLVESKDGSCHAKPHSEEEAAKQAAKQEAFDAQVVQKGSSPISERAQRLLEKLRKTYGNMEFFVMTPGADAKTLLDGSTKEVSVLFSVEELEKMASDAKVEKEYMDRVQGALRMSEEINKKYGFESAFGKDGDHAKITKIGISFNSDGTTSFFAGLEKSSAAQREHIAKVREERRTQRKEEAQKAAKEKQKERLEGKADEEVKRTTVQADSLEALMEKIREVDWNRIPAGNEPGLDLSI